MRSIEDVYKNKNTLPKGNYYVFFFENYYPCLVLRSDYIFCEFCMN